MSVANTLAYYDMATITIVQSAGPKINFYTNEGLICKQTDKHFQASFMFVG